MAPENHRDPRRGGFGSLVQRGMPSRAIPLYICVLSDWIVLQIVVPTYGLQSKLPEPFILCPIVVL